MADQMQSAHLRWREGLICPTEHVAALTHLSVSLHTTPELAFSPGTACATCTFNSSLIPQMSSSFISKHNKGLQKGNEKACRRGYVVTCVPLLVGWSVGLSAGLQRKDRTNFNQTCTEDGSRNRIDLITFQCGSRNFKIRFSLTSQG